MSSVTQDTQRPKRHLDCQYIRTHRTRAVGQTLTQDATPGAPALGRMLAHMPRFGGEAEEDERQVRDTYRALRMTVVGTMSGKDMVLGMGSRGRQTRAKSHTVCPCTCIWRCQWGNGVLKVRGSEAEDMKTVLQTGELEGSSTVSTPEAPSLPAWRRFATL